MRKKRLIEVFSANCSVCNETVEQIEAITCESCDISVLDMRDPEVDKRAKRLGIRSVPAVVVDGQLLGCCAGRGVELGVLRSVGVGTPR